MRMASGSNKRLAVSVLCIEPPKNTHNHIQAFERMERVQMLLQLETTRRRKNENEMFLFCQFYLRKFFFSHLSHRISSRETWEWKKNGVMKSYAFAQNARTEWNSTVRQKKNIGKIKMNYSLGVFHERFSVFSRRIFFFIRSSLSHQSDATSTAQCTNKFTVTPKVHRKHIESQTREWYFLRKRYEICRRPFQVSNSTRRTETYRMQYPPEYSFFLLENSFVKFHAQKSNWRHIGRDSVCIAFTDDDERKRNLIHTLFRSIDCFASISWQIQ